MQLQFIIYVLEFIAFLNWRAILCISSCDHPWGLLGRIRSVPTYLRLSLTHYGYMKSWRHIHGFYMRRKNNRNWDGDHYLYASVRSRRRRIVLEEKTGGNGLRQPPSCKEWLNRRVYLRTVAAAVVDTVHAPPAITFLHAEHFQMPTAWRFTVS